MKIISSKMMISGRPGARNLRAETELRASSATAIYSPWKARAIDQYPSEADELKHLHPSDLQVSRLLIYQSPACSTDLLTIFHCCAV